MNNNICKWGNSHKQTLLYKVKNISKKLARKLFMSLLVTSAIFCTANLHTAYAAHSLENSRTGFSITVDNSDSAGMSLTDRRIQNTLDKYLEKTTASQTQTADTAAQPAVRTDTSAAAPSRNTAPAPIQTAVQTAAAQTAPAKALSADGTQADTAATPLSLPMNTAAETKALPKAQTVYSPVLEQYTYAAAAENNAENTPKTLEQEMLAQSLAEHNAAAYGTAAYSAALNTADTAVYTPALQSYTYALPAASQTDSGSLSDTVSLSGAAFTPTAAMSAAPAFAPLAAYSTGTDTPVSPLTGMTEINNGQIIADGTAISDTIYNNINQRNEINANTDFNNVEINYTCQNAGDILHFTIGSDVTELDFSTVTISTTVGTSFTFAGSNDLQIITGENTFTNKGSDQLADRINFDLQKRSLYDSKIHGSKFYFSMANSSIQDSTFDVKGIHFFGAKKEITIISDSDFNFKEFGNRTFNEAYNQTDMYNFSVRQASLTDITMNSSVEQDFYLHGLHSNFTNINTTFNGNGLFQFTANENIINNWTITNNSADASHRLAFYLAGNPNFGINQDIFEKYDDFSEINPDELDTYRSTITINGLNYTTSDGKEAEINLLGGNITGNILAGGYEDILNLYQSSWKPDANFVDTVNSAASINFTGGTLYIDNLIKDDKSEFEGNLTIKDTYITYENEADTLSTYYLPKNTVLQGDLIFNLNVGEKIQDFDQSWASGNMQTADILEAQKGDTQTWVSITDGGNDGDGGFDLSSDMSLSFGSDTAE